MCAIMCVCMCVTLLVVASSFRDVQNKTVTVVLLYAPKRRMSYVDRHNNNILHLSSRYKINTVYFYDHKQMQLLCSSVLLYTSKVFLTIHVPTTAFQKHFILLKGYPLMLYIIMLTDVFRAKMN